MFRVVIVVMTMHYYSVLESRNRHPNLELCHYEVGQLMQALTHTKGNVIFRCEAVQ